MITEVADSEAVAEDEAVAAVEDEVASRVVVVASKAVVVEDVAEDVQVLDLDENQVIPSKGHGLHSKQVACHASFLELLERG